METIVSTHNTQKDDNESKGTTQQTAFCVLCAQCCLYFLIVYYWLSLLFAVLCFLFCLSSFRLVLNVACISVFSIIDCPFCLMCCSFAFIVVLLCVVCPMLPVSLDCLLLIAPSVRCVVPLLTLSSFCVLCAQCCLYLWILYYWLSLLFAVLFLCCVYKVCYLFHLYFTFGLLPVKRV
jgi:hypothetical protein